MTDSGCSEGPQPAVNKCRSRTVLQGQHGAASTSHPVLWPHPRLGSARGVLSPPGPAAFLKKGQEGFRTQDRGGVLGSDSLRKHWSLGHPDDPCLWFFQSRDETRLHSITSDSVQYHGP